MILPFGLLALLACKGDSDTGGETAEEPWALPAEAIGDAMLLSAWDAGDELLIVGGDLTRNGGHGDLLRWDGETLCVEEGVTNVGALWWIHGESADEWWAVGAYGNVVHDQGGVRTREDLDTQATLYGVWVDGDVVWAVGGDPDTGEGEIWKRSNGTWEAVLTELDGAVFKVWDGWFVGDGHSWQLQGDALVEVETDQRMVTVRGRTTDDVWVVGGDFSSMIRRNTGSGWEEIDTSRLGQPLNGVWTDEGQDVWVTGNYGTQAYGDETGWSIPDFPLTSEHFHAVTRFQDTTWFLGGNFFSAGDNYGTISTYGADPGLSLELVDCP